MFLNFLISWTNYYPKLHAAIVGLFALSAMIHLILKRNRRVKNGLSTIALFVSLCAFTIIILLTLFSFKNLGYSFWIAECVALTGFLAYTPLQVIFGGNCLKCVDRFIDKCDLWKMRNDE